MEARGVHEGLRQKHVVTEARRPVPHQTARAQREHPRAEVARAAAEEVANLHNRLPGIEIMLAVFMVIQIPMTTAILTTLLGSN